MNVLEFVIVIVIAGMIYSAWRSKHLARSEAYEDGDGKIKKLDSGREAELEREIADLRERVKVLERIATDGRETRLLADEIDKLRDR